MMTSERTRITRALKVLTRLNEVRGQPDEVRATLFVEEAALEDELDNIDGEGRFNRKDTEWYVRGRPGPMQPGERKR